MRETPAALLMDFDGVVLDSMELKTQAFATVYDDEPRARRDEVLAYQRLHGGVSRRAKFAYFEQALFGRAGDVEAVERLAARYRELVYDQVLQCSFVPGAPEFLELAHERVELHVISGTPQEELADIVERRGLRRYFRSVVGAPTTKRDAFAAILAGRGLDAARTAAIGDAMTEYWAAEALGIPFIGVAPAYTENPFPPGVPVLDSLSPLPDLLALR